MSIFKPLGGALRIVTGVLGTALGIVGGQHHENCVWVGAEVLVGVGMGILGLELGLRWAGRTTTTGRAL